MKSLVNALISLIFLLAAHPVTVLAAHDSPDSPQPSACPQLYPTQYQPRITNPRLRLSTRELCSDHYATRYSGVARAPLYAVEYLTKGKVIAARDFGRANDFREDKRLSSDWRAKLSDFRGSGFDRGHLAASANMPTPKADSESFLLTNIVAQDPHLNRNLWAAIEKAVRAHAQHRPVYVYTGVLFLGEEIDRLKGRVLIPTHIYKLLYDHERKQAAAYLVENKPNRRHKEISLQSLQDLSGIEFIADADKIAPLKLPRPRY